MNRFLIHIILVFVIIGVTVINGQMKVQEREVVTDNNSKDNDTKGQTTTTTMSTTSKTTSTPRKTKPKEPKPERPLFGLTETQLIIVIVVVIAFLALLPLFFLCKCIWICLCQCCQPEKSEETVKDTTESTGIKFSSVKTVDSITGQPIRGVKQKIVKPSDSNTDIKSEQSINSSKGTLKTDETYENIIKNVKNVK